MIKKGMVVTIIFILSTFVQLLSQIITTRLFGAKLDLEIFLAAVTIPTIVVTIIYSTFNDAFLPLYGQEKAKNPKKADSFFVTNLITLSGISLLIAILAGLCSPIISNLLYANRGEDFIFAVARQMNIMFYSIPLSVIATLLGSYAYSHKKFIRFPLAQLIGSIANIGLIILLVPRLGIQALVIAFVANIFIQILFIIPRINLNIDWKLLSLKPLFFAIIPLTIGAFALRSDTILIRSFGASLPEGYLVYLNLVSKIFALATGVMTIGLQIILLPHLVEHFSNKRYSEAIKNINKAKVIALFISILITITLVDIAPFAIHLLFVGNKFTKHDADVAISLIPYFIIPAVGWGINSIYFQPLIALRKTTQLGIINVLAMIAGWTVGKVVYTYSDPLLGITCGLITLLFTGIIGSELLWQKYKKNLTIKSQ